MSVIQIDPPVSYRAAELEDLIQKGELLPGVSLNQSQKEFLTTEAFRIFLAMNLLSTEAEKVKRTTFTMPIMQHVRWDKEGVINTSAYLVRHAARFGPIYMDGTEGQHRSDPYPDGKKQAIWQGMTIWTDELVRKGVPKDKILYTGPAYNTPDEHNEMIKLAIAEQWKDVVIIGNS
ncbi:MAG TPA: hypothetical protein VHQ20_02665, partial [Patescibacteria group bacterium]|nr:hypothetical protein [Patescibacteria group bacterium]